MMDGVRRVYLDQNKWIDLARAAVGDERGSRFVEALAVARRAVADGTASFPLDSHRYWETSKRGKDQSRNDVIDIMLELSRGHTMASSAAVLAEELDIVLRHRLGQPAVPRRLSVFGEGVRHLSRRDDRPETEAPASNADGEPGDLSGAVEAYLDARLLRQAHGVFKATGAADAFRAAGAEYVRHEERIRAAIVAAGLTGDQLYDAVRFSDLGDIRPAVEAALRRFGIDWQSFSETPEVELVRFMDELPTRRVTNVMRTARLRQGELRWSPNDLADVLAIPVAAVYCDIVITERQWAHHLRGGGVDRAYGTTVLTDTNALAQLLEPDSDIGRSRTASSSDRAGEVLVVEPSRAHTDGLAHSADAPVRACARVEQIPGG